MKKFAVLFDMDGVIVDTNPAHKIAILQFCDTYNKRLSDEELTKYIWGRTNKEWIRHLFGDDISDTQLKAYADEKELLFRKIYEPHVKLLKGLKEFLDLLELNNIPKAVGTSAPPENVDFIFKHTGIKKHFNTVLDERSVSIGKPNPEIYLKVAKALNFDPGDCIVIEDSLSGVEAGKRAGCKVIGITTTHSDAELSNADLTAPDFTTLSLNDLATLFKTSKYGS
jgi:HAD superfamily hydrolase (TIGR01509 family)